MYKILCIPLASWLSFQESQAKLDRKFDENALCLHISRLNEIETNFLLNKRRRRTEIYFVSLAHVKTDLKYNKSDY